MKNFLLFFALLFVTISSYAHVYEIRVNQAQDGSLTWYLITYHGVNECGHSNAGLTINGVNYPIDAEFGGDGALLSPNVFATVGFAFSHASYATVHTPFLGTNLTVAPYSNNVCWAFSVGGSGNFTPPPPPVCTSCPITGWSNTIALPGNNNGTACDATDDYTTATVKVNHLTCASITGSGQFNVVFDPGGANINYGPFNYSAGGNQTDVSINIPYGASNSTMVKVEDTGFPCELTHGLNIPGGQYLGEKETNPPTFASLANVSVNNDAGVCGAIVNLPQPSVSDDCGIASLVNDHPSSSFPIGSTVVTWTATDINGNTSSASQTITVSDTEAPVFTLPSTTGSETITIPYGGNSNGWSPWIYNFNDPLPSGAVVTGIDLSYTAVDQGWGGTGGPSQMYVSGTHIGTGVLYHYTQSFNLNYTGSVPGYVYGGNNTLNMYFLGYPGWVAYWQGGSMTIHYKIVAANANPPAITVNNISGTCGATVSLTDPDASDNCGSVVITNDAPATYPVGITTVTWTATDDHNNSSSVTQTITVIDNEAPTITTPAAISVSNDAGNCSAVVNLGTPATADNCGVASVTNDHTSATYPVGTTVITWTVTDIHGNSSQTTQSVTVTDTEVPNVITQPVSITLVNGEANVTAAMVDGGSTDNCGIASMTLSSPTQFHCSDIGDHTVTLTVTDIHGNVSSASAIVTVLGAIPGCSITPVPTSNVYTGGNPYNIYLGYGPQSTVLQVTPSAVSGNGGPNYTYTYSWSGASVGMLNSTGSGAPEFTPTAAGLYEFTVTTTNQYGCSTTCTISICVRDIRVVDKKGRITDKVYVCHVPPGNNNNPQTLSISVNAVPAHLSNHSGDKLGSCDMPACGTASSTSTESVTKSITTEKFETTTTEETLKVTVMPNPSNTYFTLKLESKYETPVNMRVMDGSGRMVDAKSRIGANSTIKIGHNYTSGTYYVELIQGAQRKVVRLIKVKG